MKRRDFIGLLLLIPASILGIRNILLPRVEAPLPSAPTSNPFPRAVARGGKWPPPGWQKVGLMPYANLSTGEINPYLNETK